MSLSNVMWVEKYRPKKMTELVNQKEIVGSINSMLKNQSELPHLLFSGSAGVGKTTAALCLSSEILREHWRTYTLELNASDERGINMVRERVKKFSRFVGLDMTSDAQTALRRIIEDTSKICRFILIANNLSKIIAPIQSRCVVFKFTRISDKDIISQLKFIAKQEKIKTDEKGLQVICDSTGGDLRHAINILQAAASSGDVTESIVKSVVGLTKTKDVQDVLKLALDGKISDSRDKMIELIKVYGMSESDFLKYINQAAFNSKTNNLEGVLETIAKYDYRILVGANPEIQLSALLAELAKFGK